ncbi:uncharacterized protein MYCFIDRAFT_180476 [Pseudocercospora fijiensis CIRAD86]|uniref:Uncharacterized protein n=1 Tax=Pseudocercospora fijiensis (strain CIRAD86) TaxID=383855 RepID=M3AHK3_PSEFD|nr:uncharacterized protein MYCFIDRAFT_180476 [Pseudocercospora fijiensis CIRAD86]EME76992.1 hypothetical protein MYCFIDRAFT_180476 [Pseudocercospora fijiensis CIRAD86]
MAHIHKHRAREPLSLRVVKDFPVHGTGDRQPLRGVITLMQKDIAPMLQVFMAETGLHFHDFMPGTPQTSATDSAPVLDFEDGMMQPHGEDAGWRARISSIIQQVRGRSPKERD